MKIRRRINELGFAPSLLISSLSGAAFSLGAPPNGHLWGAWLGFVPLLLMARRPGMSVRQALWLGIAGGMGVGLGGFPWIATMLVEFVGIPWVVGFVGLVFFSLWMAIPYGIFSVGLRLGPSFGWPGRLWAAALFASLMFLWPALFPYTPLIGFAEHPEMMQLAELGGVHLIEALVVLFCVFVSDAVMASSQRERLLSTSFAIVIPAFFFAYGSWRMAALDAAAEGSPSIRVGVIQPNVPVGGVGSRMNLSRLQAPSARAERLGAEVVIWPEAGAYPYLLSRPIPRHNEAAAQLVHIDHSLPTVFGVSTHHPGEQFGYNTVLLMNRNGDIEASYDKVNLVPLGEYIPIIDPEWLTDFVPTIAHHFAGEGPARFVLERAESPVSLGPLICYEDIVPAFVREVAAQAGGVELFVNVTIDAWYGDSAEPWEHLALAQFRSVEHRIPMVRSVSTGVSAAVDYNGRLVRHIPLRAVTAKTLDRYPPEVFVETIVLARNTADQPTIYARFGWLFPYLCVASVLVATTMELVKTRRES
jgi:apolipoprotein N-acyltransferase